MLAHRVAPDVDRNIVSGIAHPGIPTIPWQPVLPEADGAVPGASFFQRIPTHCGGRSTSETVSPVGVNVRSVDRRTKSFHLHKTIREEIVSWLGQLDVALHRPYDHLLMQR